jgi:glycosyltransferase involved in cell wall biosynthesis
VSSARLRVLQLGKFYPPHMGGMETHLQALCEQLQRSVDVRVIVASDDRQTTEELIGGIRVTRAGTAFHVTTVPICPGMAGAIRKTPADLVHIHWPNPAALLSYLVSGHRGRLIVTYHSDIVRQRVSQRLFQPILNRTLRCSAAIIASSAQYVETSPVLSDYRHRCHVIPYGVDLAKFERCDRDEVNRIRRRHGPRIVVSVGRLVYYKGFEYLIEAMTGVSGRLLVIGDGPLRPPLERQAIVQNINDSVIFLGEVRDIVPYYHAADVFVLPSVARSEAFGIVQLEAMACGKPVVNTRLESGVPFVSPHGITGLTVPPADPGALADAINLLLGDVQRRTEFGNAGRRRVQEEFSLELMIRRTLDVYDAVGPLEARERSTLK